MKAGMKKIKDLSQLLPEPVCHPHPHHCLSGVLSGPPVRLYQRFFLLNHDQSFPASATSSPPAKRTVKNDCFLTHTVMTSTCALLLPFSFSVSPFPPTHPTAPPPSYLPLSFLPHSSSLLSLLLLFQLFFLSYKKTKKWMSPFLLPMSHNAVLCMRDENVSVKKKWLRYVPSAFLVRRRKRRSTCCPWTTWRCATWRRVLCPASTYSASLTRSQGQLRDLQISAFLLTFVIVGFIDA